MRSTTKNRPALGLRRALRVGNAGWWSAGWWSAAVWVVSSGLATVALPATAATFTVDTTIDELDGSCLDDCSLRDALALANADPNVDEIVLDAATYQLTRVGADDTSGDLDVLHPVVIRGVDLDQTVIEQTVSGERVLQLAVNFSSEQTIEVRDLELTGGELGVGGDGGGVWIGENARFIGVRIAGNAAPNGFSGGAWVAAGVEVSFDECVFENNDGQFFSDLQSANSTEVNLRNTSVGPGSGAGSLFLDARRVLLDGTTVQGAPGQGAILADLDTGATMLVRNSTLAVPLASGTGDGTSSIRIQNSTLVSTGEVVLAIRDVPTELSYSLLDGECDPGTIDWVTSLGNNVGTSNDCFVPVASDQVSVDPADLFLGPLRDNGGPSETFAITDASSVLVGATLVGCPVAFDQRGTPRNSCDIGAFEREEACYEPSSPLAVPDDDATGVSFSLASALEAGADVDVLVDIDHPSVGDLVITLEGPGSVQVPLLDRPAGGSCSGEDVRTIFDDEASFDSAADCRSVPGLEAFHRWRYRPVGSLSLLGGASGSWNVTVSDRSAGDIGSVHRVCLITAVSLVFTDGFESGDLAAWSATLP